jgi:hypothetical protein
MLSTSDLLFFAVKILFINEKAAFSVEECALKLYCSSFIWEAGIKIS